MTTTTQITPRAVPTAAHRARGAAAVTRRAASPALAQQGTVAALVRDGRRAAASSRPATELPAAPATPATGIEWASPAVEAPDDGRLDPNPATEGTTAWLHPFATAASMRRSLSARRARRLAARPELESVFPEGHPGFALPAANAS